MKKAILLASLFSCAPQPPPAPVSTWRLSCSDGYVLKDYPGAPWWSGEWSYDHNSFRYKAFMGSLRTTCSLLGHNKPPVSFTVTAR